MPLLYYKLLVLLGKLLGLVLESGKYFSIVGAAPKKLDQAHGKEMNELLKSIAAVE